MTLPYLEGMTHAEMKTISDNPEWRAKSDELERYASLRKERDRLLAETDYLALSDQTLSADMTTYRQELRDLPATSTPDFDKDGKLTGVTWPTKPE
tara:strand:- start:646 stop:933 length:288 start_codon:yes stop_codon:yes gene_type:complete